MKIVVIGGSGLIGSKVVAKLINDPRQVIADPHARYFGAELSENSLVPVGDAQLGATRFEDWLNLSTSKAPAAAKSAS